ncbi:MAG TPA: UDP-N-acetylmuramate--L-alanine ligase [Thermomicrobiales bacterium]|nr:UDP-N-acetylmuramate--L-alanine ligase [Thermomicrobiales bacterium]
MSGSPFDPSAIRLPEPPARAHFVGIGGVGVSALARMLRARGHDVSGSDLSESAGTRELAAEGVAVAIGHDAANVTGAAVVVTTSAARDDNVELKAAREQGIPVVKRAALLGLLANDRLCLAVAGTHGKSTTCGMAALALERAGQSPSFAVGATVRELGTNARQGSGDVFVVEADEYDYSFLWLRPRVAIVTNIEHDHPDIFPDFDSVLDAFARFVRGVTPGGQLVIAADDAGCRVLLERFALPDGVAAVTFGERDADWTIDPGGVVRGPSGEVFALRLSVPGRHNQRNALSVLAAASGLGIDPVALVPGLESFGGVSRRFETLADSPALTVVSDYAHHPTEVAATIEAARERFPNRRVLAVFQPHTYSRTRLLLDEFASALDQADVVVLADIYRSRETDTLGVSSSDIASRMRRRPSLAGSPEDATTVARRLMRDGDVALVMGAGDIHQTAEALAAGDAS